MNPKQILASHRPSVVTRVNQPAVVVAIEDTTDLDYTRLKQTIGLGFICQTNQQSIKVHSCLAVSGEGEPLGLLHPYTWSLTERSGKAKEKRKKGTSDKESQRWLDTLTAAEKGIDASVCMVHVVDREAAIYDLFVQPRRANSELLIRVGHNRKVQHEMGYLLPTIEQAPVLGECTIELERNPERSARSATVIVRGMQGAWAENPMARDWGIAPFTRRRATCC